LTTKNATYLQPNVAGSSPAAMSSGWHIRYQPSSLIVSLIACFAATSRGVSNPFCDSARIWRTNQ
jgi:hypothetical protein